jgi:hypothetical protein
MTCIRAYNGESAYECRRVASSVQSKGRKYNAVATSATLHQQVAVPLVGHGQCEGDSKFLSINSSASVHYTFDSAICWQRRTASLVPGNGLGGSGSNGRRFGDFNILDFEVCQFRAGVRLMRPNITSRDKHQKQIS